MPPWPHPPVALARACPLKPPFPWFGGKSRAAPLVWERFGRVDNYVEPFAGSLAVLLHRPSWHCRGGTWPVETVNDLDAYLANFWRCLAADPEELARWADWPVNEADLHARHDWLLGQAEFRERMHHDPDFCDPKIAGWWVWGLCQWIGSGWCAEDCYSGGSEPAAHVPSAKLPHLGNPGRGVHRPSQKLPHLGNPGRGDSNLLAYFAALASRLHRVRVCCGDWSRVLGESPTVKLGTTGVLLDPPYATDDDSRQAGLYGCDSGSVAHDVRAWALEHGANPELRIALCGYAEHDEMAAAGWTGAEWKAAGGYGSQGNGRGRENAEREVIWFSPGCLSVEAPAGRQSTLDLEPR